MATVHKWGRHSINTVTSYQDTVDTTYSKTFASGTSFYGSYNYTFDTASGIYTLKSDFGTYSDTDLVGCYSALIEGNSEKTGHTEIYYIAGRSGTKYTCQRRYAKQVTSSVCGDYIDAVESDNLSAYPENGEHNGYWYVYVGSEETFEPSVFATIDGVQKKLSSIPAMVDGVQREIGSLYSAVDGVMREIFRKAASPLLPDGYTPLGYIQSTGAQYIDTGFIPNQDTRVVMTAQFDSVPTTNVCPFGVRDDLNLNAFAFFALRTGRFRSDYNNQAIDITAVYPNTELLKIDFNKNVVKVNDITACTFNYAAFTPTANLTLFCLNTKGAKNMQATIKLIGCEIYDNGTPVRDYVPCINPDGEIGLFDLVTQEFYNNDGTGAFTGG